MRGFFSGWSIVAVVAAATLLGGCGGTQTLGGAPAVGTGGSAARHATQRSIEHLIVVVQADRSFDDLFSGFPGADAPAFGCASGTGRDAVGAGPLGSSCPPGDTRVPLKTVRLAERPCTLTSSFANYFSIAWDGGKMDGWNQLDPKAPLLPVHARHNARHEDVLVVSGAFCIGR